MAIAYYGTTLSPNMDRTPEGFLICRNVPINRTGTQIYGAGELNLTGDPDRAVRAYRLAEDVFDPAALADGGKPGGLFQRSLGKCAPGGGQDCGRPYHQGPGFGVRCGKRRFAAGFLRLPLPL